jgi:hypothetical protein
MNDLDRKGLKILIPIIIILAIFLITLDFYKKQKLKKASYTTAIVTDVGVISYRGIIDYEYKIDGNSYLGSQSIKLPEYRKLSDEELEKIDDLKIKYSIESPWISKIIDERIK